LPTRHLLLQRLELDEFGALLAACERHRTLGQLAAVVRDGVLSLEPEQHAALEETYRAWLTHALRVERVVIEATRVLDRARIPSRVLKGVALAHTTYDDPDDRVFGDVDLLVPAAQFSRAASALADALGGERAQPELRAGFDDRFGKEIMLRVRDLELDLHRTFVEGAYGMTVDLDDLFAPPYRFRLGVCELEALPMPQRLLHACYAAALGDWPPRLGSLRDVAQIVHRERPHLADVLLMARKWKCEPVVARAVTLTWDELALTTQPPIVAWAQHFQPSATQQRLLRWHEGPARAFTRHLAAVLVLPTHRDQVAYLQAIMFPQRSYLQARGFTALGNAKRAWARIRR
jgi:hypothetical protein